MLGISGEPHPPRSRHYRPIDAALSRTGNCPRIGMRSRLGRVFPFETLQAGQREVRMAHAEPPFRLRVVSLKQSSCVGRHCCVLGPDKTLVGEFGYFLPDDDPRNRKRFKRLNPRFLRARWLLDLRYRGQIPSPQRVAGSVAILNNPWCHNFYHWMLEVAPALDDDSSGRFSARLVRRGLPKRLSAARPGNVGGAS